MTLVCPECLGTMRYSREDAMYICSNCGHEDDGLVDEYEEDDYTPAELACKACFGPCGVCREDKSLYVEDGVPF